MVVRALVPAGYMVAPTQDGRLLTISLCSGRQVVMDMATGEVADPAKSPPAQNTQSDAPCVFAAVASLAAPEAAQTLAAPLIRAAPAQIGALHTVPGRGLAAPPPWSTGPPLTA